MSILKRKLARIQEKAQQESLNLESLNIKQENGISQMKQEITPEYSLTTATNHSNSSPKSSSEKTPTEYLSPKSKKTSSSNNIMKNYCRAIINFTLSPTAMKYLAPLFEKYQSPSRTFRIFIQTKKSKINCIKQLRAVLLVNPTDNQETIAHKTIFQQISIIFLKFFAPNWLFNSNIADKQGHLKFRFKILRRVKDPIHFTYLQGFDHGLFI